MRLRERVGRGAHVHAGTVQDEVLEGHELAREPGAGASVGEVGATDPAIPDRTRARRTKTTAAEDDARWS